MEEIENLKNNYNVHELNKDTDGKFGVVFHFDGETISEENNNLIANLLRNELIKTIVVFK